MGKARTICRAVKKMMGLSKGALFLSAPTNATVRNLFEGVEEKGESGKIINALSVSKLLTVVEGDEMFLPLVEGWQSC